MTNFITREHAAQAAHFARRLPAGAAGYGGAGYRLSPEHRELNLAPDIRGNAASYFVDYDIIWHRHANHGLSSQVCCLNFLMPLATRPELLARVIGHALDIAPPTMLEIERGPGGQPWFVGFEWIGRDDYLNETGRSGARTRGANVTSADAIVRFEHQGRIETVLIEWKYTETYGASIPPRGNEVRLERYKNLVFAPAGPIRADQHLLTEEFFWEPFYQMLRQQMLAFQMQAKHEDGTERVRVLHISPAANRALHNVTAPALKSRGNDAFEVFRNLLTHPDDFVSCTTETVFEKALAEAGHEGQSWATYINDRYTFMNGL